ncbi:hypothetical protein DAPPUDRAFT_250709 [Daphnia pulex]|uniref:Uncharacterized protein n=1 Tax=Daphnia pulex TaxID=6669 RepID=E9GZ58_DAPPU|nr:hypothetical protein DAPPUDRAFT_250709 [Daphnia pulex]|eukprot:EFX75288.1 hypothetical protein DAPPUDRAFT_250709 [Daphnia pulex]
MDERWLVVENSEVFSSYNNTYRQMSVQRTQSVGRKKNNMASKTKAEENITLECDEHDNPRKKNKMDLPDVENENLNHLVKKGVDTISYENSSLKELKIFYTQQRIEELELDGVMHVFRGDPDFRNTSGTVGSGQQF